MEHARNLLLSAIVLGLAAMNLTLLSIVRAIKQLGECQ
jgi:multisubunit Na+/H+ antiporter MnhC subunit